MGQEFFINSQELESKIRQLLPSQGGAGAGFDLSASTQIIPIIDLTESAQGSNLRQDLQTSIGYTGLTNFAVQSATNTTIVSNTGYWRVWGKFAALDAPIMDLNMFDGTTSKKIVQFSVSGSNIATGGLFDYIVYVKAGESVRANSPSTNLYNWISVSARQIATINGELVNP
jgi:rRNA processing protein Krr1/Pno1|tara:strand:- start:16 stop:531 length:516 start_codon:yes stop_codon:yes gene_type:complete